MKWLRTFWDWFSREPAYLFDEQNYQEVFGNGRNRHENGGKAIADDATTSSDAVRREKVEGMADSGVERPENDDAIGT